MPTPKRLLLLGGGHAHLFVLEALARERPAGVEVTLVSPLRLAPYSGMMPGVIAGHYRYEEACADLQPLCAAAGVELRLTRAVALDLAAGRVLCADGGAPAYDLLSIDSGSTPGGFGLPGIEAHGHPVKPIERFVADVETFCRSLDPGRAAPIVVAGAGAAGCEVLFALDHRLGRLGRRARFTLVSDRPRILPGFAAGFARRVGRHLAARGVEVVCGTAVAAIEPDAVRLADGRRLPSELTVWATGSSAPDWPRAAGLAVDAGGFILVDAQLRSLSHPQVYAAGDIASMRGEPRPKSGVYAVRAGPPLARNLIAALSGTAPAPYRPQRRALALLGVGPGHAIGVWGPWSWEGRWVWRWKDRIDRAFIARFDRRPEPARDDLP